MSQIGLKALSVIDGAEKPSENNLKLTTAWLNKINKINKVVDKIENVDTSTGSITFKKTPVENKQIKVVKQTPNKVITEERKQPSNVLELYKKTTNKMPPILSNDDTLQLLSGNFRRNTTSKINEQDLNDFISETDNEEIDTNFDNKEIEKIIHNKVHQILLKEVFSKNSLKSIIIDILKEVLDKEVKISLKKILSERKR
jgi:hypothetical protein